MSTVLITGNLGYLGSPVVRALKEDGHWTVGLDTGWFLNQFAEPPVLPHVQFFRDIRSSEALPDVDIVVHLAGLSNDPMGDLDPQITAAINSRGTLKMVRRFPGARHVIASSCSVYGTSPEHADEDTPVKPLTPYAVSKAFVDANAPRYAENLVSLRFGTAYGYAPGHRLDLVVNRMAYDSAAGAVTAFGNAGRPLTHVDDIASAVAFMARREETGVFNVVGENVRMHDLARLVGERLRVRSRLFPPGSDQRDYFAYGSKLAALGWEAERSVADTIEDLAEHTYNLPVRTYERLPALKNLIASRLGPDLRERTAA